jgi:hypothetical protein
MTNATIKPHKQLANEIYDYYRKMENGPVRTKFWALQGEVLFGERSVESGRQKFNTMKNTESTI